MLKKFVNFSWYLTIFFSVVSFIFLERGFFIFGEASFFALFFGPLTCIYSLINKRYLIPSVMILFYSFYIPNLTIVLFLFVILIYRAPLKYLLISSLIVFVLVTPSSLGEYFQSRVTLDAGEANASSLLYLINWLDIKIRFDELIYLGDGIGHRTSGLEMGNDYVSELKRRYKGLNSSSAGTFITARLVRSIGLIGVIPSLFVLIMLAKSIFKAKVKNALFADKIQFILYGSLMPALLFRGSGLLSFTTFLFVLSVAYTFNSKVKNGSISSCYLICNKS